MTPPPPRKGRAGSTTQEPGPKARAPGRTRRLLLLLALLLGTILALLLLLRQYDSLLYEIAFQVHASLERGEKLRAAVLEQGWLAPFLFIGLQVLQVVLAPIPGEASGALGGYLFGTWPGFLYSTIGLTIGSWLAFALARLFSDLVRARLERMPLYHRFNRLVSKGDFVIPFLLFLLPGFPKDSLSYLLGLSHMPLPVFLFITTVGRMPGTLMLSAQGAQVHQGNYLRLALLLLLSGLAVLPCYLGRHRIMERLSRMASRSFPEDPLPADPAEPRDQENLPHDQRHP